VLLVESGGVSPEATTSSLLDIETTDLPLGREARERALGGTTRVWWGGSALLAETDLAPRPWLGTSGWPITRSELMPYYSQGCRILGIPDLTAVSIDRFVSRRGFLIRTLDLDTVSLFWPRRPRRFRDLLQPAVQKDPGLEAYLYANVTRIVAEPSGRKVERVEIRTSSGRQHSVRPNTVVLACGGIENARLLLASGGPAGLGNDRDLVGRFYMDHPKGVAGVVKVNSSPAFPHPGYWDDRPGRFRLGVRLSNECQRREGLLNGYLRFHPTLESRGRGVDALRDLRRRGPSALRDLRVVRDLAAGFPSLAAFARFKIMNRGRVEQAEIHNFIEQTPSPQNRVRLSDRLDPFGNPLPRVEWTIGESERRTMRRLHALVDEEVQRRGFGRVDSPLLADADDPWPISRDASHHMGTTRMGNDPSTSIVDRDCRIHGIANLYVAGSSVFPTSGSANPTLTIVALSLRLANHLSRPA
jgi:choline dehydrogenase-like flavoprotein